MLKGPRAPLLLATAGLLVVLGFVVKSTGLFSGVRTIESPNSTETGNRNDHENRNQAPADMGANIDPIPGGGLVREGQRPLTVSIQDKGGAPIEGKVVVVENDDSLYDRLVNSSWVGSHLWASALVLEDETFEGRLELPRSIFKSQGEFALLVKSEGYFPRAVPLSLRQSEIVVTMKSTAPIIVNVTTENGVPIPGAYCWIRAYGFDRNLFRENWILGMEATWFSEVIQCDSNGKAIFVAPYPGPNNTIQVNPISGFSSNTIDAARPGEVVSVVCGEAFSAKGTVKDGMSLLPIIDAAVSFVGIGGGEWKTISTHQTNQEGAFRIETLPANQPVVLVVIRKEGYAKSEFRWYHPPANSVQRQDFFLEKAVDVEMQVVTAWGEPISNADTYFRARRFDDGPSAGRTDENGFLRSKSLLAAGRTYALILGLEGSVWLEVNQLIQPTDNKVVVPGLAQIAEVRLDEEQFPRGTTGQLAWSVLATETNGEIIWPLGERSPILPAGPGRLTLRTESTALQMQTELAENGDNVIDFRVTPAALNLEWLGPGPATITLYGEGDFLLIDEQEFAPGPIRIPCWEGNFRLTIAHEGGKREIPVTVTAPSVDIGPIGGVDTAAIFGRVMGADGPFPGVYVDLDLPEGTIAASSLTDEEGYFRIDGLAPGEYNLFLTGDSMFGPDMPEQRRAIFLKPGEEQGPFELTFLSSVDGLHGKVVGDAPAGTAAWMLVGGHVEQDLIEPDRSFHLRRPAQDTTVGLTSMRRGLVMVTAEAVPAGAQQMEIGVPTHEHQLKILDPQGKPRTDVVVQAFYQGAVLPFQAVPDNGGRLTFRVQRGLDIDLQFRLPDGSVELVYYDDIANHREITLPTSGRTIEVQVQGPQGRPIPGTVAMRYGVGDVMHADGYGKLLLGETETKWPYQITAAGYLGQWISPTAKATVTLQPLLSGLRLDLDSVVANENIRKIRLNLSGLPEGAAIAESFTLPFAGGNGVGLPSLPACQLMVDLLNQDDKVIAQKSFELSSAKQSLAW